MPDLSSNSVSVWASKLPPDIAEILSHASDDIKISECFSDLESALKEVAVTDVPSVVRQYAEHIKDFGRPRRLRLMAWIAKQTYPDGPNVIQQLTGEAEEGAGSAGAGETGVLFLEDIKALAEVLSRRLVVAATSEENLAAAVSTAVEIESEVEFRQGGL